MRTVVKFLLPSLATAALLAGCGSSKTSSTGSGASQPSSPSPSSESSSAVLKTATNAKLGGTILVDAHGMTLYSLSGERSGKFICANSGCTQIWHPLTGSTAGASVGSLATVKRPDGTEQVAYKGMPLYTFAQDRAPGEANGQGLKDVGTWNAVTVKGAAAAPAPSTTNTTAPEGAGHAY